VTEGVGRQVEAVLGPVAQRFGVALDAHRASQLARYAELLLAWNERVNLSGAHDLPTLLREHVADALPLAPLLPDSGGCLDVGSGAGLPGLVLAILRPDLSFELAEPSQKRRAFLAAAVRATGLENVTITGARAQQLADERPETFAFAVARAVFPLSAWLALGARLVRPGGVVVGLSGGSPPRGLDDVEVHAYDVGAGPRTIVVARK
jgi:16S rRNA (guanine527-N7)-methyltransferase